MRTTSPSTRRLLSRPPAPHTPTKQNDKKHRPSYEEGQHIARHFYHSRLWFSRFARRCRGLSLICRLIHGGLPDLYVVYQKQGVFERLKSDSAFQYGVFILERDEKRAI